MGVDHPSPQGFASALPSVVASTGPPSGAGIEAPGCAVDVPCEVPSQSAPLCTQIPFWHTTVVPPHRLSCGHSAPSSEHGPESTVTPGSGPHTELWPCALELPALEDVPVLADVMPPHASRTSSKESGGSSIKTRMPHLLQRSCPQQTWDCGFQLSHSLPGQDSAVVVQRKRRYLCFPVQRGANKREVVPSESRPVEAKSTYFCDPLGRVREEINNVSSPDDRGAKEGNNLLDPTHRDRKDLDDVRDPPEWVQKDMKEVRVPARRVRKDPSYLHVPLRRVRKDVTYVLLPADRVSKDMNYLRPARRVRKELSYLSIPAGWVQEELDSICDPGCRDGKYFSYL